MSPVQAAYELRTDPEWWGRRIMPLRTYYRAYRQFEAAVKAKRTKDVPTDIVKLVMEVDKARIELEAEEMEAESG